MEQIVITHRSGTQLVLQSRGGDICSVTGATQSMELNGNDTVTLNVESAQPIDFLRGDTIDVHGATYTLNELPKATKTGNRRYKYTATFEGLQYMLLDTAWLMPFSALNDTYTGTLKDFADLIITNMQRLYGEAWQLGDVPSDTETKTLSYTDTNCLDVLQNVCAEWEVEFAIATTDGINTLSLHTKVGSEIDRVFEYGKGGGLYELQRNGASDADFGTRIYFYGGSDNIPTSYFNAHQSPRLCLPHKITSPTIPSTSETVVKNDSYIEFAAQVNLFGRVERTKVFEDIYPQRTGKVTAIDSENRLKFSDTTTGSNAMFDLNAKDSEGNTLYLIAGATAQIHFQTGSLAGYDFDIAKYDHSTRTFTINAIQDENNYVFPSEGNTAFRIAVGDEYIITNINMPQSYITAAQNELQAAALDWYNLHCAPALEYTANMAELFVKGMAEEQGITDGTPIFHLGDTIKITDTAFGLDGKEFRIVNLQRNLLKQYAYTLQIAEVNPYRAKYTVRRRNRILPGIVERLGLEEVAYNATQANRAAIMYRAAELGEGNASRIALIVDEDNFIRPVRLADGLVVGRMIAADAVGSDHIIADAIIGDKIKAGAIVADKIADGAVGRAKIATKAINSALIDNNAVIADKIATGAVSAAKIARAAVQSQHIMPGVELLNGEGRPILNAERGFVAADLHLYDVDEDKTREYTLLEDVQNGRDIRTFLTGNDAGELAIYTDERQQKQTTLLSLLGTLPSQGMRADVAKKANADNVPTLDAFNTLNGKVGDESTSGTLLYRAKQLEVNKANASDVPTIAEINTRFANIQTIRTMIDTIYSEMSDWNSRISTWTSNMQKQYPNTPSFPQSKTTCAHQIADEQVCRRLPSIDQIIRS